MIPKNTVTPDGKNAEQMLRLMEALEEDERRRPERLCSSVISDKVMEAIG